MFTTHRLFLLLVLAAISYLARLSVTESTRLMAAEPVQVGPGVDVLLPEPPPAEPELTPEQYAAIHQTIQSNVARLAAAGKLPPVAQQETRLAWPLRPLRGESLSDFGYSVIANHVDHNSLFPNALQDFACGVMTYDTSSGYNHQGTDILLTPFQWRKMDAEEVAVVAAAPGIIVYKRDGQDDRSCGYTGQQWNAVYVRHNDGSIAWYGHMKRGSVTAKDVGDPVVTGEVLGLVGSSGNSSTPHLHFELYDAAGRLVDPFAGQCNATTASSWWLEQPVYKEAGLNKLTTGDGPPQLASCPQPGVSRERTQFQPGEKVYFTGYFRHFAPGLQVSYEVLQPDGTPFRTWQYTHAGKHMVTAWLYRYYRLPSDAPEGVWTFAVTFVGQRYETQFRVGEVDVSTPVPPTATATATVTNTPVPPTGTATAPPATATPTPTSTVAPPTPTAVFVETPGTEPTPRPVVTAPPDRPPALDKVYLPLVATGP